MTKGKNICIVCKNEIKPKEIKNAKEVVDDRVITTIRNIKRMINVASNNRLYICKEDLEKHKKRRQSFEKSILLTLALAVVVFLALAVIPVIGSGAINVGSIILGLVIAGLLTVLCGFLKYVPAVKV